MIVFNKQLSLIFLNRYSCTGSKRSSNLFVEIYVEIITDIVPDFVVTTPKYSAIGHEDEIVSTIKNMQMFENYGKALKWTNENGTDVESTEITSSYFTFGKDIGD